MQVSIESSGDITRKLTITVPAADFDSQYSKRLNQLKKGAKMPGFRPGKIPAKMLEAQYGGQAAREAIDQLINESYPKALEQESISPAGLLVLNPTQFEKGKDFIYEAEIEVYPEVERPNLSGVEIQRPQVEVTEADVDRTLDVIRERKKVYQEADKAAEDGDQVVIDFVGTIEGEAFAGGTAQDVELVIGAGQFLAEFEEGVRGAKAGEEKTVEVNFPEDYHGKEVAGKTAEFALTIKAVKEGELPEINEDFVKELEVKGGVEEMMTQIRSGLERELTNKLRDSVREQVLKAAEEKVDFTLPTSLVNQEKEQAAQRMRQQFEQQGMKSDGLVDPESFTEEAQRRVKLGLIVRAVIESDKLEISDEQVKERAAEIAATYDEPEQFIEYIMSQPEQKHQISSLLIEEAVVDALLAEAKVVEESKSYEEFMNG